VGRNLTIWFLCLGSLLLFFFWGRLNPVVSLFTVSLAPLPVYLADRRLGFPGGLLLVLAVSLLIFCWRPGLEVITENLGFGELLLMGFLLSTLESRGWTADRAIILTVVGLTLLSVLFLSGQAYFSGLTPKEIYSQKAREITELLSKVMAGGGDLATGAKVFGFSPENVQMMLRSLLPALVITNTGLVAWINVILGRQLLVLLKGEKPEPPLYYWSAPEWLIFPVLALGFLLLVPVPLVRQVSLNLLIVAALLYFCQGVAVVAAWFQRFRLPLIVRCIGYPLIFLHPMFMMCITTLGLLDLWLDFRRLHQPLDA
jgi:uncharacterized protein YybS (DUF2232 family)